MKEVPAHEYMGTLNSLPDGSQCTSWNNTHYALSVGDEFPDETVPAAENFCRNPDLNNCIWCFVKNRNGWGCCAERG